MIIRRTKCVFLHRPSGRKHNEISNGCSVSMARARQDRKNARILKGKRAFKTGYFSWGLSNDAYAMIEANRIDDHKFGQIIFVRNIIAVPCDNIER